MSFHVISFYSASQKKSYPFVLLTLFLGSSILVESALTILTKQRETVENVIFLKSN